MPLIILLLVLCLAWPVGAVTPVRVGIDVLLAHPPAWLLGKKLGLVTNRSAVDGAGRSTLDRLAADDRFHLVRIFAPEHGLRVDSQSTIVDGKDSATGLPIVSLYGAMKQPSVASLAGLDALLFDIQDVGARFFTYQSTMALCMKAAREANLPFVVLDRPDPINGREVEGALLDPSLASFVGYFAIPVRHGLTLGELARLYNDAFGIGCRLTVVPLEGWNRGMWFDQTGLPWVNPSPAMKTPLTATLYPGICLFEATNVDCRVGDRPFEKVGASWIDGTAWQGALTPHQLPGVRFAPFRQGAVGGVELLVSDRDAFRPVLTGLTMVSELKRLYPERFKIEAHGFDELTGASWVRQRLERGVAPEAIAAAWQKESERFRHLREAYLLYP